MSSSPIQTLEGEFTPPGTVQVSSSALNYARAFIEAIKGSKNGDWIVTFSWCEAMSVKRGANEPYVDIGSCIALSAFERHQIPQGFIQTVDDFEFAMQIPRRIWEKSARRIVEFDESLLFRLALR
jgi:hypothetical protein